MLCQRFIRSRDEIKRYFKWSNQTMHPVCAYLFCAAGRDADGTRLLGAQALVKGKNKWHSSFRNNVLLPLCCMLAMEEDMEGALIGTLQVHQDFRACFHASDHLALAAALLRNCKDAPALAVRAKQLYGCMRKQHAFLTDAADSILTLLLAQSDKADEALLSDMQQCYGLLKAPFGGSNWTWQAAQLLSLSGAPAEVKCARLTALFDKLREHDMMPGRSHALPALAALSLTGYDEQLLVMDLMDADKWLAEQPGYGFFGHGKRMRLLHALLILACESPRDEKLEAAVLGAMLSLVIAQQQAAL